MADGNTTNYNLILPEIDGADGTWGVSLNSNLGDLDSLLSGGTDLVALSVTGTVTAGGLSVTTNDADASFNLGTGALNITTTSQNEALNIISTQAASSNDAPEIRIFRDVTGSVNNHLGALRFKGRDSGGTTRDFARVLSVIRDAAPGSPKGRLFIECLDGSGTLANSLTIDHDKVALGSATEVVDLDVSGDVEIQGTVEAAGFSGTSSVEITDFVTDVSANNNDTTVPTTAAVKSYVDTTGGNETLAQTLALGNTTGGTDLQITAGDVIKGATVLALRHGSSSQTALQSSIGFSRITVDETRAALYYGFNAYQSFEKLATTITGVDVTGTVEADGFSGTGSLSITDFIDDDTFATATATNVPTAESVKAYVDANGGRTLSQTLNLGNTSGGYNLIVDDSSKLLFRPPGGTGSTDAEIYNDGSFFYIDSVLNTRMSWDASIRVYLNSNGTYLYGPTVKAFTDEFTVTALDNSSNPDPKLILERNSSSPAASDSLGQIVFRGDDSGGANTSYVTIDSEIVDAGSPNEGGKLSVKVLDNGVAVEKLSLSESGTTLYGTSVEAVTDVFEVTSETTTGQSYSTPVFALASDVTPTSGSYKPSALALLGKNSLGQKVSYASFYAVASTYGAGGTQSGSLVFTVADGSGATAPITDLTNDSWRAGHSIALNINKDYLTTTGYIGTGANELRFTKLNRQSIKDSARQDASKISYDLHMPEGSKAKIISIGGIGPYDTFTSVDLTATQMCLYRGQQMLKFSVGAITYDLPPVSAPSTISDSTANIGDVWQISNAGTSGNVTIDRDAVSNQQVYWVNGTSLTQFLNNPTISVGGSIMLQAVAVNTYMIFNATGLTDA